jgi:hypothetical protein
METINTKPRRCELPNIPAFRHRLLRNRRRTASNAARIRKNAQATTVSEIMSPSDHVQAFRGLLGGTGVVVDPVRLATYITDQRQLFTGSTLAVLKPAMTEQVAEVVKLAARLGIVLVPQGGNTSYCGGATPDASGRQVIVSLERRCERRPVAAAQSRRGRKLPDRRQHRHQCRWTVGDPIWNDTRPAPRHRGRVA